MANFKIGPETSPGRHASWLKIRWRRGTHACPERRNQPNLTSDHGARGRNLPTRDATLVIPGSTEELLQIVVGPRQARNPVGREEIRSVAPTDLQEVLQRR